MKVNHILIMMLAVACEGGGGARVSPAPPVASQGGLSSSAGDLADSIDPKNLLLVLENPDPGVQAQYESTIQSFAASATATSRLLALFSELPESALLARRKVVYLATQIRSSDVLPFLEKVALAKASRPALLSRVKGDADQGDNALEHMKKISAIEVVKRHKDGAPEAAKSVERLLREGEREIALTTGIELFAAGILSSELQSILKERGIPYAYKRVKREEQLERMRFNEAELHSKPDQKKNGSRPPELNVP
jgi:hypothetical protein